jgi:NitT/TauT family transport system substrate-binding protein
LASHSVLDAHDSIGFHPETTTMGRRGLRNGEDTMGSRGNALVLAVALLAGTSAPAAANDVLRAAIPQRGLWDTSVTELGKRAGIFQKHGLDLEILFTQGGPEAYQAVISGSMDVSCGGGIEGAIGAFAKGAPLRIIGSEMVGSPDTYWYVVANSPIHSLKDAVGKTISYSQNGSSSHAALLSLLDQYKVAAKPVATGGHPATLTMTMTGQIDIGRGAAPFGLEAVENGTVRIIARGSEITARANETVRVCVANVQTLQRNDVVARYLQAYRETLDWMYSDPTALSAYEEFSNVPAGLMQKWRDEFFPKSTMSPDEIKGLDLVLADVLKNKFVTAPLTREQIQDMIQIPAPLRSP